VSALAEQPPCAATQRLIDCVGESLPVVELPLLTLAPAASLLDALQSGTSLLALTEHLSDRSCVACRLGVNNEELQSLRSEIDDACDFMRPGELLALDGSTIVGLSPSGAARGDRFVLLRELMANTESLGRSWPALKTMDITLANIASELAANFKAQSYDLDLIKRSDTFVACFPGDGMGYGSHFDGDEHCRLTMILYIGQYGSWQPSHGGCLDLLDEQSGCWWRLPPRAGTLVLFRSDRVLHRVQPCHEVPRYALTVFLSQAGLSATDAEREALVRILSGMI